VTGHEEWCAGAHTQPYDCWQATRMRRLNELDPVRCPRGQYHAFVGADPQAPCEHRCGTVLGDIMNHRSTVPTAREYLRQIGEEA